MEGRSKLESLQLGTAEYCNGIDSAFPDLAPKQRGTLLHRAFELLSCHPERAALLTDATGILLEPDQALSIIKTVSAFDKWLAEEFSPLCVKAEMPILALDSNGTVISGTADMIVETADALWIIDHKSDLVKDRQKQFIHYLPQLDCYAKAVSKARTDKPVQGVAINWVSQGVVSLLSLI